MKAPRDPLVSCVLPAPSLRFVSRAIDDFLRQDYGPRELLVIDDGRESIEALVPADDRIRYLWVDKALSAGALLNFASRQARGDVIALWKEDIWHAPHKLLLLAGAIAGGDADVCGFEHVIACDLRTAQAWRRFRGPGGDLWIHPESSCYRRAFWEEKPFPESGGDDLSRFVLDLPQSRRLSLPQWTSQVCLIHERNSESWAASGPQPEPCHPETVLSLLGSDAKRCGIHFGREPEPAVAASAREQPQARPPGRRRKNPPVSCILSSRNRRMTGLAIEDFLRQDYQPAELIVVEDGDEWIAEMAARDGRIRCVRVAPAASSGARRNAGCGQARGDIIVLWDENSWRSKGYLACVAGTMVRDRAELCIINPALSYDAGSGEGWLFEGPCPQEAHAPGGLAAVSRKLWKRNPFADSNESECMRLLWSSGGARKSVLSGAGIRMDISHDAAPRHFDGPYWRAFPPEEVRRILGGDRLMFEPAIAKTEAPSVRTKPGEVTAASCILLARDNRRQVGLAVELFLRQNFRPKELVIVDDGDDPVRELVPADPQIRYVRLSRKASEGARRNAGCSEARGGMILHWDARAWYGRDWIHAVVQELRGAAACGLNPALLYDVNADEAWLHASGPEPGPWFDPGSLCYLRPFWNGNRFPDRDPADISDFLRRERPERLRRLSCIHLYLRIVEGVQAAPGIAGRTLREPYPVAEVRRMLGEDRYFYEPDTRGKPAATARARSRTATAAAASLQLPPRMAASPGHAPLVSCIMPTANRRSLVRIAIECFRRQDYEPRELIVVDDGSEPIADLASADTRIRWVHLERRTSIGAKRNLACERASGEIILHWDDDDWHAPGRIRRQVEKLQQGFDLCGISPLPAIDVRTGAAWSYRCPIDERSFWAAGGSLCYRRVLWERNRFPDVDFAEDRQFLYHARGAATGSLSGPLLLVAVLHGANAALREPRGSCWTPRDPGEIRRVMEADWFSYQPGEKQPEPAGVPPAPRASSPLVSCIMPTCNRRRFVPLAVRYFLRQDYEPKELIVIDDGTDSIEALVPGDPRIRYVRLAGRMPLGAKRNLGCELAGGDIILHWDDDDWQAPRRIRCMVDTLLGQEAELCGLNPIPFYDIRSDLAWLYRYPGEERFWVAGTSFCYRRRFWEKNHFAAIDVGEDNQFIWRDPSARMVAAADSWLQVAILHEQNGSPKATGSSYWHAAPSAEIRSVLGSDVHCYRLAPPLPRLNLGCGETHRPDMWNVDIAPPADQIVDLRYAWPWSDSSFELIVAHDIIEHLPDRIFTMNEAWRVLRPGGRIEIAVPTTEGQGAFQDPTHQSYWNRRSFLYFESGNPHRERFAGRYGVTAAFRTVSESTEQTENGPRLTITLEAVKA